MAAVELDEALTCAHAEGRTAGNFAPLVYLMGQIWTASMAIQMRQHNHSAVVGKSAAV